MSKTDNTAQLHPGWLNKTDMAKSLRISTQAFDKWGVEPVARVGRSVYFDCAAVLEKRLEHQAQKHQPTPTESEEIDPLIEYKLDVERKGLIAAQRIGQEQKNAVAAKEMIPAGFATFALSRTSAEIATILDTLGATMRRKHPDLEVRHLDTLARELSKARNLAAGLDQRLPELLDDYIDANT
ncbi:terminase small subunit [Salinicola endophyticus]|uniref:Terminase small subunit n=1 Tax=Salinicola endophyticus TaxID=1949083 RepID=A0AB74UBZ8_9GAMM